VIPYSRQSIDEEDIQAVVDVLRSDFLTQGPVVEAFERELCRYTNAKYAVACTNGTAALHLAMLALGVMHEDIVWTTPISFVASSNCALYCGAKIDFVDIDLTTFNISISALALKLEQAALMGNLPKVVVVVHFAGNPVYLKDLKQLSDKYGFKIVEDACHALGASYLGSKIGECRYSDITVFSFHPVKSITCGEGGALMTNNESFSIHARLLANHGITKDPSYFKNESHGDWYYEQQALGFNYRLSDIHAALGLSQMRKLDTFIEKRAELVAWYQDKCKSLPVTFQNVDCASDSAWHLLVVLVEKVDSREAFYDFFREKGVGVQVHYVPIYTQPYYKRLNHEVIEMSATDEFYKRCITLPLFPLIDIVEAEKVVDCVRDFYTGADFKL